MLHCAFCTTAGVVVRWYFGSSEFSSRGSSTKARSHEITVEMHPRCAEFSSRGSSTKARSHEIAVEMHPRCAEFSSRGSSTKARSCEITVEMHPRCLSSLVQAHTTAQADLLSLVGRCLAVPLIDTTYLPAPTAQTVLNSLGQTLRYSLGSLVVGSLLMIPGRIFRFFLEHCLHQAREIRRDHRSESPRS